MSLYYVVEKDNDDWDFDSETIYTSRAEAEIVKKEYENRYGVEYVIWEVS